MSDVKALSLYAIDAELLALEDALVAAGGAITEEIEAEHDHLLDMREDKVEGYLRVIRRLETTAEAIKAERQRLQGAERSMTAAAQALKDRLAESMRQRGDAEYLTPLGRLKLQRSGTEPVELLVDEEGLPEAFVRTKHSPDLTALREALRSDDPTRRAEAERVAQLGESKHYVRLY
jgi:hypothetical protein